jgi:enterochelin esterase-like enzyme
MTTVNIDGVSREMTAEEQAEYNAQQLAWENTGRSSLKLNTIKEIRLQKLKETDYYALQDVTMSNEMKAWRQSLRDIPANHTNEEAYDLLLARDENGNLTHSVWSKP